MFKDPVDLRRYKRKKEKIKIVGEEGQPSEITVRMELDEKTGLLIGKHRGRSILVMEDSRITVGETWECNLVSDGEHSVLYPQKKVEAKSEAAECPPAPVQKTKAKKKTQAAETDTVPLSKYKELEEKSRIRGEKLSKANLRIGNLTKQLGSMDKVKEENKRQKVTIQSLKTQVKALEKEKPKTDVSGIEIERDRYKYLAEELQSKVERLTAMLELYNSGTRESQANTFLLGKTRIHCNLLDDERYRVYFSPGKKTLRFVPDQEGQVYCDKKEVILPAIAGYTNFEEVRRLEACTVDGEVRISLV